MKDYIEIIEIWYKDRVEYQTTDGRSITTRYHHDPELYESMKNIHKAAEIINND